MNPIGLQDQLAIGWRWALSGSTNRLLADAHFSAGVSNTFSPAYDRLELWAEISPLSVLDIKAGIEPVFYFGTFGHLVDFPSYDVDFGKAARDAAKERAVSRTGVRYHVSPTFKIKLGRFLARTGAEIEWWRVDAPGEFFYEPMRDTLLRSDGDSALILSTQVFYELAHGPGKRQILAGLFHDRISVARRAGQPSHAARPDRRVDARRPSLRDARAGGDRQRLFLSRGPVEGWRARRLPGRELRHRRGVIADTVRTRGGRGTPRQR